MIHYKLPEKIIIGDLEFYLVKSDSISGVLTKEEFIYINDLPLTNNNIEFLKYEDELKEDIKEMLNRYLDDNVKWLNVRFITTDIHLLIVITIGHNKRWY